MNSFMATWTQSIYVFGLRVIFVMQFESAKVVTDCTATSHGHMATGVVYMPLGIPRVALAYPDAISVVGYLSFRVTTFLMLNLIPALICSSTFPALATSAIAAIPAKSELPYRLLNLALATHLHFHHCFHNPAWPARTALASTYHAMHLLRARVNPPAPLRS